MLLERLRDYTERLDLPPTMYQKMPIRWLIDLDASGSVLAFVVTQGSGRKNDRGREFLAPHILRASGIRAKLLADNGEYVLGLPRDRKKQKRVDQCHEAFTEQVRTCAAATDEPTVRAVVRFLEKLDLARLALPGDFDPSYNVTFRVQGNLPIHLKSVQDHWAAIAGAGNDDESESAGSPMECLICGQTRKPVKRLQFKIKRVPGGQPSGMALISANVPAFESYGLEASLIAPTCQDCGERFSKAANALIEGNDTHITIGALVYLFWTKEEVGFSVASLLSDPQPDEVRELIASAFSGKQAATRIDATPFYTTAFSASGGRVVVRDWLDTTVLEVRRHLGRYFALQQIVDRDGSEAKPHGLYALAASTVRDIRQELPPNVPKVLLNIALKGGPLPRWLLFQAIKRNRAEQRITQPRAALIKIVLLSSQHDFTPEDATMVELDPDNHDPAYLCGRLLAVLESIQHAAIPGARSTITNRFFGTASSAPASVFGRLIRGAQAHLGKLRHERRGTYEALERKLEEVQANLLTFPKTLTLEQQGLFGLGYYHQRAADRAAAIAYKQAQEGSGVQFAPETSE